jgi:hypothetical protein
MICTMRILGKESGSEKKDLDINTIPTRPWRPREARRNGHMEKEDRFIGKRGLVLRI